MDLCDPIFDYLFRNRLCVYVLLPGDSLLLTVGALCSVIEFMHLGYMISLLL